MIKGPLSAGRVKQPVTFLNALWAAEDLHLFGGQKTAGLYSSHRHYINFRVKTSSRLLVLVRQGAESGPAALGLKAEDFQLILNNLAVFKTGLFEKDRLILEFSPFQAVVYHSLGKTICFAPPVFKKAEAGLLQQRTAKYLNYLIKNQGLLSASPALVLFNLPGADAYFRKSVAKHYPQLVAALLEYNSRAFLKAAAGLIGLGRGFSPSGDDLIAGALLAAHYFNPKKQLFAQIKAGLNPLLERTNCMGAHMILNGALGLAAGPIKNFLLSFTEAGFSIEPLQRLLALGSSTGLETALAVIFYLQQNQAP